MSGQGARPGGVHGLGELGSGGSVQASLGQEDRGRRDGTDQKSSNHARVRDMLVIREDINK